MKKLNKYQVLMRIAAIAILVLLTLFGLALELQ